MKLIVLYGPSNSGKTTTLKMVYEVLKKLNTKEERRFNYLDLNMYLDFRDVLILERPKMYQLSIQEKTPPYEDDDFNNNYPSNNEESHIYNEDELSDDLFPDDIGQEDDKNEESDDNDSLDEEFDNDHIDNYCSRDIDITIDDKSTTESHDSDGTKKIGIILEGDHGCASGACVCKTYRIHKKICNNIQDFQDCDIIICACSQKNPSSLTKPSNCIKWAIKHYHASFIVERSHKFIKSRSRIPCSYYLRREKRLANRILRDLFRIW